MANIIIIVKIIIIINNNNNNNCFIYTADIALCYRISR